MSDRETIAAELAKPLDPKHVKPPQKFGPKGDYIEGWHAIAEANRIFGWDGWTREVADCRCVQERERPIGKEGKPGWGVSYVARVRVTAGSVVREGTGAGHGIDVDLGNAHESAIKEAETDAMKRALMTFGNPFGLALYDKTKANVGMDAPKPPTRPAPIAAMGSAPPKPLSEQAAPAGPREERILTKQEGEAILLGINGRKSWRELDEYMDALGKGPMAFAVNHPKIKVAVAEKRAAFQAADPVNAPL